MRAFLFALMSMVVRTAAVPLAVPARGDPAAPVLNHVEWTGGLLAFDMDAAGRRGSR